MKKGEIGICIQTFIAGPSLGVPQFAANNRTFSATGGTYKTNDSFIVTNGNVRDVSSGVGATARVPGLGSAKHSSSTTDGVTTVTATANARTMSPWPPFNINYNLTLTVDASGIQRVSGTHDGFPSYEIWQYKDGEEPRLVYKHDEGNVGQLAGCCDVNVQ